MDKINEFDKELERLKEMNKTIYMMIVASRNKDGLAASIFQEELVEKLEKFEDIIPCRGTIKELLEIRDNYKDNLYEKYKEESRKRLSPLLYLDSKDRYIDDEEKNEDYNVVEMAVYGDTYDWWYDLIGSNLSLKRRSSILIDILSVDFHYDSFLECASYHNLDDKIKEIFRYINETPDFKYEVFIRLLKQRSFIIGFLQENGYVDFGHNCAADTTQILAYLLCQDYGLTRSFIAVFNDLTEEEKEYYVPAIIRYSKANPSMVSNTACKLKFKPNKQIVDCFSDYTVNNFERIERELGLDFYREEVSQALIKKASNKKEYKEYKKYVEDFLEKTDYKKHLEEKELNELELSLGRLDLSTLLFKLDDKLQEEYPGKMKLKNIDFKKQS